MDQEREEYIWQLLTLLVSAIRVTAQPPELLRPYSDPLMAEQIRKFSPEFREEIRKLLVTEKNEKRGAELECDIALEETLELGVP